MARTIGDNPAQKPDGPKRRLGPHSGNTEQWSRGNIQAELRGQLRRDIARNTLRIGTPNELKAALDPGALVKKSCAHLERSVDERANTPA